MAKQTRKPQARKSRRLTKDEQEEIYRELTVQPQQRYEFKYKTQNQKIFGASVKNNVITVGAGFPGTGKTFCSAAESLRLLQNEPEKYKRIILIKSVTTLKGEEVGFMKGYLEEKMKPYIESFADNFTKLIGTQATQALMTSGVIEVLPLAFARGRTFDNAILFCDEAQNISKENLKTILTRIGQDSKIILIGDTKQIDLKDKKISSLEWFMRKCEGRDKFGVVKFGKEDQVRNPIINEIEDMFDED